MSVSSFPNMFNYFVFPAVLVATIIYFVSSEAPSEPNIIQVEELFKKTHPNLSTLDSVQWDLVENIDEARLEKVCRDVEVAVNPSKLTTYVHPTREKPLKEERVISHAPILFMTEDKNIRHMTLINCSFSELEFYLAQGNDKNHVFCLEKDSTDNVFRFRSGLHEINKSGFA